MLGMTVEDYEFIEFRELSNKLNGFYDLERYRQKEEWNRINYITYSMLLNNPYVKKSDKPKTFEKYLNRGSKQENQNQIKSQSELDFWIG